jgi:hypothetical protein
VRHWIGGWITGGGYKKTIGAVLKEKRQGWRDDITHLVFEQKTSRLGRQYLLGLDERQFFVCEIRKSCTRWKDCPISAVKARWRYKGIKIGAYKCSFYKQAERLLLDRQTILKEAKREKDFVDLSP